MPEFKPKSGKVAKLLDVERGTIMVGDGIVELVINTWYFIISKADAGSVLPFKAGYTFKTGGTTPLVPIVGDDVYPLTMQQVCKTDTSLSGAKGTIDVTDDCSESYNQMITDGYTDLSGSFGAFFKYDVADGSMTEVQKKYLNRFMSISEDDGNGAYALTEIDDSDIFIAILQNSDQVAEGFKQQWILVSAILSGITLDKALKSGQNFDITWAKGVGVASIYTRVTNATETAF